MKKKILLSGSIFIIIMLSIILQLPNDAYARGNVVDEPVQYLDFRVTSATNSQIALAWDEYVSTSEVTYVVQKYIGSEWVDLTSRINATTFIAKASANQLTSCDTDPREKDLYQLVVYVTEDPKPHGIISGSPANDNFSKRIEINLTDPNPIAEIPTCNALDSFYEAADPDIGENCGLSPNQTDQATFWYEYKPATDTPISLNTLGSDYDTFIAIWQGTELDYTNKNLSLVACNNDTGGTSQSNVAFIASTGTTYYIEIGEVVEAGATATAAELYELYPFLAEGVK